MAQQPQTGFPPTFQPINIGYRPQGEAVDIAGSIASGFNVGAGIRNELQRRQDEQAARMKAEQEQIAAMQRAAAYERDLFGVFNDPTPQNLARLQLQYPERVKEFQTGFETLDKARVSDEKRFVGEVYAAARSNPEVAKKLLTDRITALESADEDATEEKNALDLLNTDAKQALGYIGTLAAFTLDKDQIEALTKLGGEERAQELQPDLVAKGKAEAGIKQAEAAVAGQKYAFDVAKIQEDIRASRENTKLRAIEAQIAREGNAAKREELAIKRDETMRAIDEKKAARAADIDVAFSGITDARDIVRDLLSNPDAVKQATGGLSARSMIPGSTARDVAVKVERLQNTLAAANLDKIKGAMSDKDLEFLKNISSSLDRSQSEASFLRELDRIGKTLVRSANQLRTRYNIRPAESAVAPADAPAQSGPIVVDY